MVSSKLNSLISSSYEIIGCFCLKSCNANCCKNGFLNINSKEAKKILKKDKTNLVSKIGELCVVSTHPQCINLSESNLCKIYKKRPKICKEYPIKVIEDKNNYLVMFHPSCKAVLLGLLNENIRKIRDLGIIVIC